MSLGIRVEKRFIKKVQFSLDKSWKHRFFFIISIINRISNYKENEITLIEYNAVADRPIGNSGFSR